MAVVVHALVGNQLTARAYACRDGARLDTFIRDMARLRPPSPPAPASAAAVSSSDMLVVPVTVAAPRPADTPDAGARHPMPLVSMASGEFTVFQNDLFEPSDPAEAAA
jgi:hypothetical protein